MQNTKDYVITVNADNNKVTMFVSSLGVSFEVGTDAEYNVLGDWDIDKDIREQISMITAMCKNPTFAKSVLATGNNAIAIDYRDFMSMITINYANQILNHKPTIQ